MDTTLTKLPEGFVLDNELPEDFVLDEPVAILDDMDKETKARAENAQFYSTLSNTLPEDVIEYTGEMNRELYGSEDEIIARDKNISQLGFWGKINEQRKRGKGAYVSDIAIYSAMRSGDPNDIKNAFAIKDKMLANQMVNPVEGNWLSSMIYSNAQTAGQIIETAKRGGKAGVALGLTGAAVGGIGSVILPTVGEEPVAVGAGAWAGLKIGAKLGLAEGAAIASYRQGVGEMYYDMVKDGTNPEIAELVSQIGAMPYALIEVAQLSHLMPSKKKAILKKIEKKALPIMVDLMKRYTKTLSKEILEEMLQKAVTDVSGDVAKIMDGAKVDFDRQYFEDKAMSILKEGAAAAHGMSLLPLPGASIETSIATYHTAKQNAQIQKGKPIAEPVQDEVPEATPEQIDEALGVTEPLVSPKAAEGEVNEILINQIEKYKNAMKDWESDVPAYIGLRFADKNWQVGDKVDTVSRQMGDDRLEYAEYGTKEYEEAETLGGTSSWNLEYLNIKELRDKGEFAFDTIGRKYVYILGSDTGTGGPDINEIILENPIVLEKILLTPLTPAKAVTEPLVSPKAAEGKGEKKSIDKAKELGIMEEKGEKNGITTKPIRQSVVGDQVETVTAGSKEGDLQRDVPPKEEALLGVQVGKPKTEIRDNGRTKKVSVTVGKNYVVEARGEFSPERAPKMPKATDSVWSVWGKEQRAIESFGQPTELIASKLTKRQAIDLAKQKDLAPTPVPAKEAKPAERDILGGEDPIQVITGALKEAKGIVPKVEAEKSIERSKRVGKASATVKWLKKKGLPADEALRLSTAALRGPLTKYGQRFESVRGRLDDSNPAIIPGIHTRILESNALKYFQKVNLSAAFDKFIDGHYLQKNEIKLIREFFGIPMGEIAETRLRTIGWWEQLVDLWRAGLLTGIKTSMLNEMSNYTHGQTETASDYVAAGADKFISQITGKRFIAATIKGTGRGYKKGLGEFVKYMKTGVDARNISRKYDFAERHYGNGKFAKLRQGYVNTIFHLMGAEDLIFYYATEGRSYYNQALADGMNKGLKGKELNAHADKLALNPTEKMIENATEDAQTSVFMNRTALGDVAAKFQGIPVIGRIIVPFSRTPSSIAMQVINYTPIGMAKEIIAEIKKGKFDQRKFSKAFGRTVVGTAILVIGGELLKAGIMTLGYPRGERERKLWELEGKKPFSIKIGDKWRSVYVLGPAGNVLLIGGYFQQAYEKSGSPSEAIITAMTGGAKSIAEETFLRGLNQAVAAVTDPETSFNRWFSSMAGSIVPTIVADVARATDTTERRKETPFQNIINRIPVIRETLPPKLDVMGQDLPRYGGNPLEVMVDPTRPFKINQDLVVDELRRLWDMDIRVTPTLLGDRMGYEVLTDDENTVLWRRAGTLTYRNLFMSIISPEYMGLGEEDKGKEIERIVKDAKDFARAEAAISKKAEGYTDIELRKDGLVTIDVKKIMDSYFGE